MMSRSIQCNFSCCAVQYYFYESLRGTSYQGGKCLLLFIIKFYNKHFAAAEVSCSQASKKISNKWNPKEYYKLSTFSVEVWNALITDEKAKHTLQRCSACTVMWKSYNN